MSPLKPFPNPRERKLLLLKRSPCFLGRNVSIRSLGAALFLSFLMVTFGVSPTQAQTWISAVSASTTATGAGITWTTAVPSDSQVEYGTTAAYGNISSLAAAKIAAHSITLTGLAAGTTYHFRVRSGDASGVLVVSPDYTLKLAATLLLAANPASLNFGSIALQKCSAVQMTTLTSNGSSPTTLGPSSLTGANVGDFAFGGLGSCHTGQVLAPGASCTDSLKFCPTVAGNRSAADTIPNDTPSSPIVVTLSGTGSAPATSSLAVSPTSLTFAGQSGASNLTPASVSITNTGAGTLAFTGASDQPWLVLSATSGTAPSTLQVIATITGLKAGSYTGHVTLAGGGVTKTVTAVLTVTSPPVQHSVSLSWKASTNTHVVSYNVYRSTISGSSYGLSASALGSPSYTDQTVQSGATYYYVVTAVDDQGRESTYSNQTNTPIP